MADAKKPEAKKIDPFDVEALEKSLNDSATRVSTIWVSFLIFALYLLLAATTVEHRQLLLAEPVRLPVLNIDLPLWGFFFLAPILFVIFHVYVLLQVLLLGRTAAAYNDAIDRAVKPPLANATMRQRLANTLFAQIFAGSREEREGWLGSLLQAMAWITLAIAPVLILLAFQFAFLPYHSHIATWTHRVLILTELVCLFLLWPLVLDAPPNFGSRRLRQWVFLFPSSALCVFLALSIATFPGEPHLNLFTGHELSSIQCDRWFSQNFDRLHLPGVDVVDDERLAKIVQATADRKLPAYQGERTRNFRGRDLNCIDLSSADLRFVDLTGARMTAARLDRAALEGASLDRAQLRSASLVWSKIERSSLVAAQLQGASLKNADLQGASLYGAELQGAKLDGAHLQGASLNSALLHGASLDRAQLQGATLDRAWLPDASLNAAELQGASMKSINLRGASLEAAQLQEASLSNSWMTGASFSRARLQGASLNYSVLHGVSFDGALLQGASLVGANLEGASFNHAQLQGALLNGARLMGASLNDAQLQSAALNNAGLQGTNLVGSPMTNADIRGSHVWRAKGAACRDAYVSDQTPDATLGNSLDRPVVTLTVRVIRTSTEEVDEFIEYYVSDIPDSYVGSNPYALFESLPSMPSAKREARERMRRNMIVDAANDDTAEIAEIWRICEEIAKAKPRTQFEATRALFLRDQICDAQDSRNAIATGIIRNWMSDDIDSRHFSAQLARGLLGLDGKECAATNDFDETVKEKLRNIVAVVASTPAAKEPTP